MNDKPTVSILLPVYNAADSLPLCLQSLLDQTYENLEIIAIDDASTDNSYSVLRAFRHKDKRLKISRNVKRYGMAVTLNRAVTKAKSDLIAFMDPHDKALPTRIHKQVKYLDKNPKIAAVGTQVVYIGKNNRKIAESAFPADHEAIYQKLLHGLSMQFETVMVHKQRLPKDMLKFTVNVYPYIFTDLFIKLTQYGQVANIMQALHFHRHRHKRHAPTLGKVNNALYAFKTWFNSFSAPGDTPSLRSLITPLIRT